MKRAVHRLLYTSIFSFLALFAGTKAFATHIYGADFYYTWISGNTYKITLALYGDCSGASFPSLNGATATALAYNGATAFNSNITLTQQGQGVEVTPVCPSQQGQTVCSITSSAIPGVKRYIYSGNVTLNATSANWKFKFNGTMSTSSTGRSNSITNITAGTTMALEADLNNVPGPNSSPTYTTIPTPFFCTNKAGNYNPGAIDPNGDALSFSLVPGLTSAGGTVTYTGAGITATNPLLVTAGTFSFSSTTGQLAFTPNTIQKALVVSQVTETRNGVIVGTSMREMTFVVLTCNNNPPGGSVSNPSLGSTVLTPVVINVCKSVGNLAFNINPTDLDGDNIDVVANGIPAGATFTVTGNNTTAPNGAFNWNLSTVTPGTYNFFLTFTDDGCPLSSKQTLAYTINVLPNPGLAFSLLSAATCTAKAVFTLTPTGTATSPYIISGGSTTFNGVSTFVTDSLAPGTYTFHINSPNSCGYDTTVVIAPPPLPSFNPTFTTPTCVGGSNGSVTLSAGGGVPPYLFSFNGGAYSSTTFYSGLSANTFPVLIKDANSCVLSTTVTVTNPPDIYAQVTFTKPPCNHFANGSLTIAAYNSVGPYQYALGIGAYQSSGTFSGLYSGSYLIHIQNALGCVKDTTIILPDSVKIVATSIPITNVSCFSGNNGAATINASGAYGPPYTYAIGAGAFGASNTFAGLASGAYTLHVVDTEGCYLDTVISITQPTIVTITPVVVQNVSCNGGADGSVNITGGGGTPGYTYQVDGGGYFGSPSFNGLSAGPHTADIKDANGCVRSAAFTLTQPPAISAGWTSVQPQCSNSSDGSITISGSGGNGGPYFYSIDALPFQVAGLFSNLAGGTHVLHVKDANGCIKDSTVILLAPTLIVPAATVVKSVCSTLGNGKVTLTATGGTPGYTYANGAGAYSAANVFTTLAAGAYTFHVKDAHGCIHDTTITIADSLTVTSAATVTNAVCYGQSSGAITGLGGGGTIPYTYALGAGAFGASGSFSALTAGPYVLHIKDNNGCIKDTNLVIAQPTRIVPSIFINNVTCNGFANGSISISATGGTPGYTFSNGVAAYQLSGFYPNTTAGTYTLHTKDTVGCIIDTTVTVIQPTPITESLVVTNVLCNGGSTGAVTVNAVGGTPPYQYAYDAGVYSASNALTGFNVGLHTIHLKDGNNCIKDTVINITQPAVLRLGYTATQPSCNAGNNGVITITGTGGTTPYTYAVGAGAFQASGVFNGNTAGNYVLHIKDLNGCFADSNITIGEPTAITVTVSVHRPRCTPLVNGSIILYAGGGSPGYTYANGAGVYQASSTFNGLASGAYTFHVKDTHGCIKDTSFMITDSVFVHAQLAITNTTCYDTSNGQIAITPNGGTSPYTYRVQPAPFATTNPIINLHAGNYTLSVKDSSGCILDTLVTITQPSVVVPGVVITQPLCYGQSNGTLLVSATGGTPGYTYAISNGTYGAGGLFTGIPAGIDTLHVKDLNGCRHDTIVTVAQPTPLLYTSIIISEVRCFGDNSGFVTVSGTGATPPYTYASDANAYQPTNVLNGLNAGAPHHPFAGCQWLHKGQQRKPYPARIACARQPEDHYSNLRRLP